VVVIRFKWRYSIVLIGYIVGGCAGSDHELPVVSEQEHGRAQQKVRDAPDLSPTLRTTHENEQVARRVTKRLQAVAGPICRSTGRGRCWYTLQLNPAGQINAYTLKNHIVLFDGLAQYLETEDEFAAVLAHEMGHDMGGHYEKAIQNMMIGQAIGGAIFAGVAGAAGYNSYRATADARAAMELGAWIADISFSKEHEREADYIAAYLMTRAGYDPDAGGALWIKLTKAGGQMKTGMFDSHPSGPERLAAWEETVDEVRFSQDLLPNLAGAEPEPRLQQARVFDGVAADSVTADSAVALAMKSYRPPADAMSDPASDPTPDNAQGFAAGTRALVAARGQATTSSSWIAQGAVDECGVPWALKLERDGAELRGTMWWKDARYEVYGRLDHKGRTRDARAGKTKAFQSTPAPRFFRLDIVFEPEVARGRFAIDGSGSACGADFALARVTA
jgi:hypothetical protein